MATHLIRGITPPATAPDAIGVHYIDTANKEAYFSVGTDSVDDWVSNEAASVTWGNINGTLSNQIDLQNELDAKEDDLGNPLVDGYVLSSTTGGVRSWVQNTGGGGGSTAWGSITGSLSNQTDLQNALDAKVDENAPITGGTKTKITYDAKGLVTAGADATTDDIAEGATNKYYPSADASKLAGIEAGAEVNNISDVDATDLTDGGDSTLHFHSSDRDRANHTGTQAASTISDFDAKVSSNASVTANTAKVSADGSIDTHSDVDTSTVSPSNGQALIWDGSNWVPDDVVSSVSWGGISGTLSDQTDLQNALDAKVDENAPITGGTKTKITYDAKGLVTDGSDATTDDIAEGATNKYYPSADASKLAGIEAGAEVNNISDVNATDLTDGGDSALHFHSSDRSRSNHTGTQTASTISDFDTEVSNNSSVVANTAKVSADGSIDTHSDVDTSTVAPTTGQALVWNGSNWVPDDVVVDPAGADTQIQFNNAGVFGASANFTYDGALNVKGTGTTNATTTMALTNSSDVNLWTMRDDGTFAGKNLAIGEYNVAMRIGENAATSATGIRWTAVGSSAAFSKTSGNSWTAIGTSSGQNNTTGSAWTAIGYSSALNNLEGSNWIAIGNQAGRYRSGTTAPLQYFENSTYIGSSTKGTNGTVGTPTDNETVIGYAAEGNGSNTVTIGSSAVTDNYLTGKVHATSSVQVGDDTDAATAANVGAIRYRSDANNSYMDMCMQTGASTYAWVNVKTNTW